MVNITEKQRARQLVIEFLSNINDYKYDFTNDDIIEKNNYLKTLVTDDIYEIQSRIRIYPGAVEYSTTTEQTIVDKIETVNTVTFTFFSRVTSKPRYNDNTIVTDYTGEVVTTLQGSTWVVTEFNMSNDSLEKNKDDTFDNVYMSIPNSIYYDLMMKEYSVFSNLYYQFKGYPKNDPNKDSSEQPCDSFNLMYWLFKPYDVTLTYPLVSSDLLMDERFDSVLEKGHKDLSEFKSVVDEGDLVFMGTNDYKVGLLVEDFQILTLEGSFPYDHESKPKVVAIDDYWDDFNGRVIRLNDERAIIMEPEKDDEK